MAVRGGEPPAVAVQGVIGDDFVVLLAEGVQVQEGQMSQVQEVVGHLGRAGVPVRRGERADDEARVVVLGHLRQRGQRIVRGQPHQAQVLGHPGCGGGPGPLRHRQLGVHGRDFHAGAVGCEPVAVVGAAQGVAHHRPGAQRRQPVRAGVAEGGQLAAQADQAPVLAQQLHPHRGVVAHLGAAGHRVPAAAQRRVLVVEPCGHGRASPKAGVTAARRSTGAGWAMASLWTSVSTSTYRS